MIEVVNKQSIELKIVDNRQNMKNLHTVLERCFAKSYDTNSDFEIQTGEFKILQELYHKLEDALEEEF